MPIKGPSLFSTSPISTPPPRSVETSGALASAPGIFNTETSGACAFSGAGSSGSGNTIAFA